MTQLCTLKVSSIRSFNPKGFGGAIFGGYLIDASGSVLDANTLCVVYASYKVIGTQKPQVGQWWEVTGSLVRSSRKITNYAIPEWKLDAESARLIRTSGRHIVMLLAESEEFPGIGISKASRLWENFGDDLYDILDREDVEKLQQVLAKASAQRLIIAWKTYGNSQVLQWFQRYGIDVAMGERVIALFGNDAPEKIKEDPYRLLSFCANWQQVDFLAKSEFGLSESDPRRLRGAVEEVLYKLFDIGHTAVCVSTLEKELSKVLGTGTHRNDAVHLVRSAIESGRVNVNFVISKDGLIHPLGAFVVERTIAQFMSNLLCRDVRSSLMSNSQVSRLIASFEKTLPYLLTDEQREAVELANHRRLALITGGAGVGKTTVLNMLLQIYAAAGIQVFQVALAGKAAMRMQEATGQPAMTIASFLNKVKEEDIAGGAVIIIDEASMVDVISMARLIQKLPPDVRVVLSGDPHQLMPIGPGLVLHALINIPAIPRVELISVKRFGSEIASVAESIRKGTWPHLSALPTLAVRFIHCEDSEIAGNVHKLYTADPENTQILCSRRNGPEGTKALNALCQFQSSHDAEHLEFWSNEHAMRVRTGFRIGDRIICTKNHWDAGLQNGSMGTLVSSVVSVPSVGKQPGPKSQIGVVRWDDGLCRPITVELLEDLELGYAITIHKAQGSQWPTVIIALTQNRLLDRTLIYTAITRGQHKVILVGNETAAKRAVQEIPRSQSRQTGLPTILSTVFS